MYILKSIYKRTYHCPKFKQNKKEHIVVCINCPFLTFGLFCFHSTSRDVIKSSVTKSYKITKISFLSFKQAIRGGDKYVSKP